MQKLFRTLKSDESLMLAYQRGDSLAFEVLYLRHKNGLFNFLYMRCQQQQLVEDLAQEIWLSIVRGVKNYRAVAKFKTYLYQIARNKLIDYWRGANADRHVYTELDELEHEVTQIAGKAIEQSVEVQEALGAIMKLPAEQRDAFLLRQEGFSQNEIAEITNSKPETVKSRLRYATEQLRKLAEVNDER